MIWLQKLLNVFKKGSSEMLIPNYKEICKTLKLDDNRLIEVKTECKDFYINIQRYKAVSEKCMSFPIDLMFALHYRESSKSFNGVLHNGEKILGTGRLTKLVPKNRGPFKTWEDAAVDALMMKKNLFPVEWTFEARLEFAEKYNGLGYRSKIGDHGVGEYSPYVFAGTNFSDETGKYWDDGKYKATAKEAQLGVAAILLELNRV